MDAGRGRSRRSPQRRYPIRVVRPWRRTSDEYPRSHARCYSRTMPRAAHPAAIRTASRRNHPQRRQAAAGPQRCSHDRHTDKRSLAILGGRGEGMGAYPPLPPPSPLRLIPPCAPPAWPIREDVAFASLALRCRATSSVRDRARGEGKPHRRPGGSSESRGSHGQGRLMMVSPFRPLPPSLHPSHSHARCTGCFPPAGRILPGLVARGVVRLRLELRTCERRVKRVSARAAALVFGTP